MKYTGFRFVLPITGFLLLSGCSDVINQEQLFEKTKKENTSSAQEKEKVVKEPKSKDDVILVNKNVALKPDFVPENLVKPNVRFLNEGDIEKNYLDKQAAKAIENMFSDAEKENIMFYYVSGYRSYERQEEIYNESLRQHGYEHTSRYSAEPGHSEHQTGLGVDVTSASANFGLVTYFENTTEGKWLAENAHRYGFIIRYQKDKEDITGYAFEPWHLRYIGISMATEIYEADITLEEYLGVE